MGNFKQHITCSTATGIAVGGIAYHFGVDPPTCLVAAGLCSFAGMLPDIDSDTSKSFQECIYLTAGIGCILTASRLRYFVDPDLDLAMLGGAFMFLLIRFGLAPLIKKITVHRGMIHSVPMAILCGQLVFFIVTGTVVERFVKAAALTIGFLSHLILDEVYSIDSTGTALRLKRSFGTALKWTNPKRPGSVTVIYSLIFLFSFIILANPELMELKNGNTTIVSQSTPVEKTSSWWFPVSDSASDARQPLQQEIQREAAQFLSQQGIPLSPHSAAALPATASPPFLPVSIETAPASKLPPAMQIESNWDRNRSIQPARIVLQ
jgi:hypothetical protein